MVHLPVDGGSCLPGPVPAKRLATQHMTKSPYCRARAHGRETAVGEHGETHCGGPSISARPAGWSVVVSKTAGSTTDWSPRYRPGNSPAGPRWSSPNSTLYSLSLQPFPHPHTWNPSSPVLHH